MENPGMYVIAQPCIDVKDKACVMFVRLIVFIPLREMMLINFILILVSVLSVELVSRNAQ